MLLLSRRTVAQPHPTGGYSFVIIDTVDTGIIPTGMMSSWGVEID